MANLVTFSIDGVTRPGALRDDRILELGGEGGLKEIIEGGPAALDVVHTKIAAWDGP